MLKPSLITALLFFCFNTAFSQCPTVPYIAQDTVCPQQNLVFIHPNLPEQTYEWDFCPGDLHATPVFTPVSIPPGLGNSPEQMRIIKENGNFYCFIANNGFNYLVRANFGNSLNSTPTYDTLVHSNLINGLTGIELVKENGKWIAFVVVNSPARLVRLEMDSITDVHPVITDLGLTGMISPLEIKIVDHFAFIADLSGGVVRYDFQGDYMSVPTLVTPALNIPTLFGIDVKYDCISDSYFGFVSSAGNGGIVILDFGNDLSSNPVTLPLISTAASPRGLSVAKEKNEWYMAVTQANNNFALFHFGNNIYNPPVTLIDSGFGGLAFSTSFSCQLIKDSSQWHCFAVNVSNSQLISHIYFTDSCNASTSYYEGNEPVGINYAINGNYYYELTVTDSNAEEIHFFDSVAIFVLPPAADFEYLSSCINTPVMFFDSSEVCFGSITAWQWDFGDSNTSSVQNPLHTYTATGSYPVTLTVYTSNGDSGTVIKNINVVDFPTSAFTAANNVCANTPVTFSDLSSSSGDSLISWSWNFGDGNNSQAQNPLHTYSTAGNYTVTLTVYNSGNCSDSSSQLITILPSPVPSFTALHTCINENTLFINSTDSSGLASVGYMWDFGDSTTSTDVSPVHVYNSTGDYTVTLSTQGSNNCTDTLISQVRISNKPQPVFSISPPVACTDNTVQLIDNSTVNAGDSIAYRLWDFGDGNTSADSAADHIYINPGMYAISLTVATADFCDTTITQNISILESPDVSFTFTSECFGTPVDFTNQTVQVPGDTVVNYQWNLGDSTFESSYDVSHLYTVPGTYNVTLVATSAAGCIDSLTLPAQSFNIPVADFTNYPVLCTDTNAVFIDLSSVNSDTLSAWLWDFGDGNTSFDQNPQHIYISPGAKLVTLTATTINGCSSTVSEIITIHRSPSPAVNFTPTCFGEQTCFTATDTNNPPNVIETWQWNFGDSALSQLQNPCHNFNYSSIFATTLMVTDSNGCSKSLLTPVTVNPLPQPGFTYSIACTGKDIVFTDTSSVTGGSLASWSWSFNNTFGGNTQEVNYTTANAGNLPVQLKVTTNQGCSDSITAFIEVHVSPEALYTISPNFSAPGEAVTFSNQSTDANDYYWDFGDGSSATGVPPPHTYQDTGIYSTSLIVTNTSGCSDTLIKTHVVLQPENDIAIIDVNTVEQNGLYYVTAVLFNSGNVDISGFEIIAQFDNINAVHEFPVFNLPLSTPKTYTFYSSINPGSERPGYLCVEVLNPNGISDNDPSNNIKCKGLGEKLELFNLQPNPVSDHCTVKFNIPVKGNANIKVVNERGSIMLNEELPSLAKGFNSYTFSTVPYSSGVYAVVIEFDDEIRVRKFAKW